MNHFELFSLPIEFDIDLALLSERFRTLQAQFHPDKSMNLSERDRLMAVHKSAEINDAYQTLRSPVSRAEYLLFLNDLDIRHEQSTINDGEFLMQQMMLREQLEEVNDSDDPEQALAQLDSEVNQLYQQSYQILTQALAEQAWQDAAQSVRKLKFWVKLRQEIEQTEDRLVD